jgi:hypothetical protein
MFGRPKPPKQQPSEAFALEEQTRADGMLAYAEEHKDGVTAGLWRECAQEAKAAAARATAQPEPPKRKRWGR